jgi:PKD repeat protein
VDGSLIWNYSALSEVHSSPAIAYDAVYIGASDGRLLCLDKDTGDYLWSYQISGSVESQPSVADGKVYFGTNPCCGFLSYFICLDAFTGAKIWDYNFGTQIGMKSSPAIAAHKVFVCSGDGKVYAFGDIAYLADANGPYYGLLNNSIDFTGSVYGGEPDFTWYWEFGDGGESTEQNPTHIYSQVGQYDVTLTVTDNNGSVAIDETSVFIKMPNRPPSIPEISGPASGKKGVAYPYTFVSTDPDGDDVYYVVSWGCCGNETHIYGPYPSGEEAIVSHTWNEKGTFTISVKAKDTKGSESDWATFEVTMPRLKISTSTLFLKLLERFPNAFPILRYLIVKY